MSGSEKLIKLLKEKNELIREVTDSERMGTIEDYSKKEKEDLERYRYFMNTSQSDFVLKIKVSNYIGDNDY